MCNEGCTLTVCNARLSVLLQRRLMPGLAALFAVRPSELLLADLFLVKYDGGQRAVEQHLDGSCFRHAKS